MKSFIRWAGSKTKILNQLREYWTDDEAVYIEPFCGSASLFFDLRPKRAMLGDLNADLTNALSAIKLNVSVVIECLNRLPKGEAAYYRIRAIDPDSLCGNERAARFIYLNRYCFNGLYRTNLAGQFNVPYGGAKANKVFNEELLYESSELLQRATILNADFEETLKYARPGDFVYMDPPYAVSARRVFAEYLPGSFACDDLTRFAQALHQLEENGVRFVVSYADSREGRDALSAWEKRRVLVRRNIAGFAGNRRGAYEILATNCR